MAMKICCCIPDAHTMPILCVAFNSIRNEIYSSGKDCIIKVWDLESGKLLRNQQQHSNWVVDLLFVAPPVKMLFSCSLDGNIVVWSERGRMLQVIEFGGPVFCLGWDSKRKQLIAGGRGAVQLKFLELNFCLCNHDDMVLGVCCSEKGKVFTVGMDRALCIFESDRPNDTLRKVSNCHEGGITTVTYDKDGKWLVTGAYDGTVKVWSQEGHCLDVFENITDCVTSIANVTSTRCYWVTGKSKSVVVIDPLAPAIMTEWIADTSSFNDFLLQKVLHAHNKDLVVGSTYDRKLVIWKYEKCGTHRVLHGHRNWVDVLVIAMRRAYKERLLLKDTTDIMPERRKSRKARKEHRKTGTPQSSGSSSTDHTSSLRTSTAGTTSSDSKSQASASGIITYEPEIFSGSSDGCILKWLTNPDANKDIWLHRDIAPRNNKPVLCMLHHVELDLLITGSGDAVISIWNMDGQRSVPLWRAATRRAHGPDQLKGHTAKIVALCALPDLVLVSASADKSLRFWDLSTRLPTEVYETAQDQPFQDMTYSPTREELATCGGDSTVKIWAGERRKRVRHLLKGAFGDVLMVRWCVSHGGLWITATELGTISTWDPATQAPMNSLCTHREPITALLVDEENDFILVSYMYDNSIRVHPLLLVGNEVCQYTGHTDQVHSIVYMRARHQFISGSWDTTLRVWLAPPRERGLAAEKKLGLQDMMSKRIGTPTQAPSDDFDVAAEREQYVSNYEKAHPVVMPHVLANPMTQDISALHVDVSKEVAIEKEVDEILCAALCQKLDDMEKLFKSRLRSDETADPVEK